MFFHDWGRDLRNIEIADRRRAIRGLYRRRAIEPMTLYSATCNGGPMHGLRLHHGEPSIPMFKREGKLISYTLPVLGEKMPDNIEVGWYVWADGRWEWTREPPEV